MALYLPLAALAGLLGYYYIRQEQESIREVSNKAMLTLQAAVRQELVVAQTTLNTLAQAVSLRRGELDRFEGYLRGVTQATGVPISLMSMDYQHLINTGRLPGALEPSHTRIPHVYEEIRARGIGVGALEVRGTTTLEPLVVVSRLVKTETGIEYLLSLSLTAGRFLELAREHQPGSGWIAVIRDHKQQVVARTLDHEKVVGTLPPPGLIHLLADIRPGQTGTWLNFRTLEGDAVTGSLAMMQDYGWITAVVALPDVYDLPIRRVFWAALWLGLVLSLLPPLLAWLLGRRITQALKKLVGFTHELQNTRTVSLIETPIVEINVVAEALRDAATSLRQDAEQQRLLMMELNHRVKNTLASIQSIARRTFRGGAETEQLYRQFEGRILAMSNTHNLLTQSHWEGAVLSEILDLELALHGDQIVYHGCWVQLSPRASLAFSLIAHELGTNAAKYGALSVPEGRVIITWDLVDEDNLVFEWREQNGPRVIDPGPGGFGSRLIQRTVTSDLQGTVRMDFNPDGLTCVIEARIRDKDHMMHPAPALLKAM